MNPILQNLSAAVAIVAVPVAPIVSYFAKKTIDNAAAIQAHLAADTVAFQAIKDNFTDLKNGQKNQTEKLDRLVEKLID